MADYTPSDLTAAEISGFSNDKPVMVVQQIKDPSIKLWSANGTTTGTEKTDENYPIARLYDDIGNLESRSDSETVSHRYVVFDLGASNLISFDTCIIMGHNLNSAVFTSVALEIADNAAFDDDKIEIYKYTVSGTTDTRLLCTNLNSEGGSSTYDPSGTAQRYSDVRFVRLRIIDDGAGALACAISEIVLGYRYQLQRNPNVPWDNKTETSNVADFQSNSGQTRRHTFFRGQALRSFSTSLSVSAEITMIDDWFNAIAEGTRPFVYIETPSSSPQSYLMLLNSPALAFPLVGPTERQLAFDMTEQPPFLSRE